MYECPVCGAQLWNMGSGDHYCHRCGETFSEDVLIEARPAWNDDDPLDAEDDEGTALHDLFYPSEWEFETLAHVPTTPRQRIQAAVESVCQAASRIRVLLGGKDELPF